MAAALWCQVSDCLIVQAPLHGAQTGTLEGGSRDAESCQRLPADVAEPALLVRCHGLQQRSCRAFTADQRPVHCSVERQLKPAGCPVLVEERIAEENRPTVNAMSALSTPGCPRRSAPFTAPVGELFLTTGPVWLSPGCGAVVPVNRNRTGSDETHSACLIELVGIGNIDGAIVHSQNAGPVEAGKRPAHRFDGQSEIVADFSPAHGQADP